MAYGAQRFSDNDWIQIAAAQQGNSLSWASCPSVFEVNIITIDQGGEATSAAAEAWATFEREASAMVGETLFVDLVTEAVNLEDEDRAQATRAAEVAVASGLRGLAPALGDRVQGGLVSALGGRVQGGLAPALGGRVQGGLAPALGGRVQGGLAPALGGRVQGGLAPALGDRVQGGLAPALRGSNLSTII
jgi:hypothetical protein